ncbi:hypothetical protein F5I97DRAFT_1026328 [Phlebopus sp. FC_14]|nr:hypothetical protein F5I97DRAFT_1026328 [Phlebopus sp. FC_14]
MCAKFPWHSVEEKPSRDRKCVCNCDNCCWCSDRRRRQEWEVHGGSSGLAVGEQGWWCLVFGAHARWGSTRNISFATIMTENVDELEFIGQVYCPTPRGEREAEAISNGVEIVDQRIDVSAREQVITIKFSMLPVKVSRQCCRSSLMHQGRRLQARCDTLASAFRGRTVSACNVTLKNPMANSFKRHRACSFRKCQPFPRLQASRGIRGNPWHSPHAND